jgi:hypothetical protein
MTTRLRLILSKVMKTAVTKTTKKQQRTTNFTTLATHIGGWIMGLWGSILKFLKSFLSNNATTTTTSTITDQTTTRNKRKKALCIGINNYPGYSNDLRGCVNDARGWQKMLVDNYGFDMPVVLLDEAATKKNVSKELKKMVQESVAGDVLVLTFSGHGTTVADSLFNKDEPDGKDEALCVHDGLLIDDDIREMLANLPKDVNLTFISDSCHSGTVTRAFLSNMLEDNAPKPRYMPPDDDELAAIMSALPTKKRALYPQEGMKEVLISGCKSNEYSYDATFNGKPMGAFSHNALLVLRDNPKITYNDFYKKLRQKLPSTQYPQTPQLEGSPQNKNSIMFE